MSEIGRLTESKPATQWPHLKREVAAVILGLLLLLTYQQERLDLVIYDQYISQINKPLVDNHVIIVDIDDKSLAHLGEWPWSRDTHAQLIDSLLTYQVAAIGFDILFSENNHSNSVQDTSFAQAIERAGNVVLPMSPSISQIGGTPEVLPQASLAAKANKIGHVDFEIDVDGIIRQVYLYAGFQASRWPTFGLALTQIAKPDLNFTHGTVTYGEGWTRRHPFLINYKTEKNKDRIEHYSYVDVLNGQVPKEQLKNKIILIGMNATAMGDQFATPISIDHKTMAGVEINAHVINSLINNSEVTPLLNSNFILLNLVLLLISLLVMLKTNINHLFSVMLASLLTSLTVSASLFYLLEIWFPPIIIIAIQVILYAVIELTKSNFISIKVNTLTHSLSHDSVTGLLNENGFTKALEQQLQQNPDIDFQVMIIQIGKFKGVNDLLGSAASERLLNTAKERISNVLSTSAIHFSRYHGSEFALSTELLGETRTKTLCDSLIDSLSSPYVVDNQHFRLPIFIGTSTYPNEGENVDEVLISAHSALLRAQEQTLSTYCIYSIDIKQGMQARVKLESDLSKALERNEIEVFYQPQVRAEDGSIVGAEALARWRHPERGLVSPDEFIPVAESTGMIIEIGRWILQQACLQAKLWQNQGYDEFRVAVNLSPIQFAETNLVDEVLDALKLSELAPEYLELELTESGVVEDIEKAIKTLNQLKKLGVTLSIDDFGTGYSSLSYLKYFPMDRIKIDRSFITEIADSKDAQEIALAIIAMAHSLNMGVIAEGIESIQQQKFLNDNHCEELQGYYFGKPATVEQLGSLLKKSTNFTPTIENSPISR